MSLASGTAAPDANGVRIVHRDDALLVVQKPAGLATTSPSGGDCLTARVQDLDPAAPRLHASSRLDRDVTGLVTFARSTEAIAGLLEARRRGAYRRLYVGFAAAAPEPREGVWSDSIAIDPKDIRFRVAKDDGARGSKRARTRFRVGAETPLVTWLWLSPMTGRTHQLRVHASAHGAPLLGDTHYGGSLRSTAPNGRVLLHRRPMLHCAALVLPDIARGHGVLELEAPLPDDMQQTWARAGGDAGPALVGATPGFLRAALYAFPVSE